MSQCPNKKYVIVTERFDEFNRIVDDIQRTLYLDEQINRRQFIHCTNDICIRGLSCIHLILGFDADVVFFKNPLLKPTLELYVSMSKYCKCKVILEEHIPKREKVYRWFIQSLQESKK